MPEYTVTLALNTGTTIELDAEYPADASTAAADMRDELASERPHWEQLGNVVFFTGAVSAIVINPKEGA